MSDNRTVRLHLPLYGGFTADNTGVVLPFVLPNELVEVTADDKLVRVLETAPERVTPLCPHFGTCGGCQYQMMEAGAQLALKRTILGNELRNLGVTVPDEISVHSGEPYGYRNRIRVRVQRVAGVFQFGYNIRTTTEFLPISTCPISTPILLKAVEALLALAGEDRDTEYWLNATAELEVFTNDDLARVQLTLFCAPRTKAPQGSFTRMINALQQRVPEVAGAGAAAFDAKTGPTGRVLAEHGTSGLSYKVGNVAYWVSRGGFFQVNRFLVEELVQLVCEGRSGRVAWDLFAGVGLFSRVLAQTFAQITAVEASPSASADLRVALAKLGPQHRAVQQTTLEFLRGAVLQRERPELIVLDPPRAGASLEVCTLLARIAAPQIVYVSCDPTTLARDLKALEAAGYRIDAMHLVDLFPQTFHLETVAILRHL